MAVVSTAVVLLLSLLLRPLVIDQPFLLFFAAIAFGAGVGGLGPGLLTTILSVLAIDFFLIPPYNALGLAPAELIRTVVFTLVAVVVSAFYDLRKRSEEEAYQKQEWLGITLTSIGDAVISTDEQGKVSLMNPVAEALT